MSGKKSSGFTIIETMLFLAISGLLAVGVLASATSAINQQRYHDATTSFTSYIQSAYDNVVNVQNDRTNDYACSQAAGVVATTGNSAEARGASKDCTIIGLYLSSSDGITVNAQTVYATADGSSASNDLAALQASNLVVSSIASQPSYTLGWGTSLVAPKTTTAMGFRLLIARSPSSGTIRTYVSTIASGTMTDLLTDANRQDVTMCVDPKGLAANVYGTLIQKDASGTSSIKQVASGTC